MTTATPLHLARQPIFDRSDRVAGYELLYRESTTSDSAGHDAKVRSARSIEALLEMGLEKLAGKGLAFLNVDFEHVDCPIFDALPNDRLVLEILEETQPTPDNLDRIKNLALRGYTLALDDYAFQPHLAPFLEYCRIVKLECPALDLDRDLLRIETLLGSGKCVLAEKIEEAEQCLAYKQVGCHLFQGFYYARPSLVEASVVASNKAALMTLLAKVHDEHVSLREVEAIVASDVTFTYKLMKLVRSALVGAPPQVQTVGQAIQFLGLRATASVASVLAMSAMQGRPTELMVLALARAKMCEELARASSYDDVDSFFMVGLLSTLDAFLNRPMSEITLELPLPDAMLEALRGHEAGGNLTHALACARAYERGDFLRVDELGFSYSAAQESYRKGIEWADRSFAALQAER